MQHGQLLSIWTLLPHFVIFWAIQYRCCVALLQGKSLGRKTVGTRKREEQYGRRESGVRA